MTNLVIVESPNKCKKIQNYLGDGWIVKASMGHIRDLPGNEMGVDLESFKPNYVPNAKGKKTISNLKKLSHSAGQVYLATDPDREGEAIAWHLQQALNLKNPKRIKFNEITKKAVQKAVSNAGVIDCNMVHAQEGRRILDRLVGFSVTPALSKAYGNRQWITAGRVQSVAVRIVAERELEIAAFKPTSYVEVYLSFETDGIQWQAQWLPGDLLQEGQKHWTDRDYAERVANITDVDIVSVDKKEKSKRPPSPFTTSSLQQGASVALKMSPKKCMQIAQALFEGAGSFNEGLITYHRTDSPNLSEDGLNNVIHWLKNNGFADHVVDIPNTWKAKAGAQEGHEAIRPTSIMQMPDIIKSKLTPDQYQLYKLIWQRTVASQMKNAVYNVTLIKMQSTDPIDDKHMKFLAKGEQLIYQGWLSLMNKDATDEQQQEDNQLLPNVQPQQHLVTRDGEIRDKKTKPPARYTEASLVKKLESEGIGRPSTYASIIDNIMNRGYVSTEKRKLKAEELGILIYQTLTKRFQFMELSYTRDIEKQLDEIAAGNKKYFNVVSQAYGVLKNELGSLDGIQIGNNEHHSCPNCNNTLRLIKNKFWGCTDYPSCKYTAPNEKGRPGVPKAGDNNSINTSHPCLCGNGHMQRRKHQGNHFWGCSSYPNCKITQPDNDGSPGERTSNSDIKNKGAGKSCPNCKSGQIVKRTVKNGKNAGKDFYGCTNKFEKANCDYFSWIN